MRDEDRRGRGAPKHARDIGSPAGPEPDSGNLERLAATERELAGLTREVAEGRGTPALLAKLIGASTGAHTLVDGARAFTDGFPAEGP